MPDNDPPTELPRDVFLTLLDAYRDVQMALLKARRDPSRPIRTARHVDADCEGWRQRYQAAVARRLAAAPGDPLP